MGKGKGKAAQKKSPSKTYYESDEDEDMETNVSVIDMESTAETSLNSDPAQSNRVDIPDVVEQLTDKRSSKREGALKTLVTYFQTSHDNIEDLTIEGFQDTIITHLLRMVRRPSSAKEGKLCMDLICLLGLFMGADEAEFLETFEAPLTKLIATNTGGGGGISGSSSGAIQQQQEETRSAALRCLSVITFVCGGLEAQERILSYCEQLLHGDTTEASAADEEEAEVPPSLRGTAVDCWVLLATLLDAEEVCMRVNTGGLGCSRFTDDSIFDSLLDLLQNPSSNIDSKIYVGRAMGFLWESALRASPDLADFSEMSADAIAASVPEAGRMLCHNPLRINEALQAVRELSKDSSKRVSKRDRKEQRAEFREVEDWLGRGEAPAQTLRMQGAVVETRSFAEARVVAALKDALGGTGFHSALRMFPVVKDILSVEHVTSDMDGNGEDWRLSKNSGARKKRTQQRKQDRSYRDASCAGIAYDEGEEG